MKQLQLENGEFRPLALANEVNITFVPTILVDTYCDKLPLMVISVKYVTRACSGKQLNL